MLAAEAPDEVAAKMAAISRIRGIGATFAALTREVFYRRFDNPRSWQAMLE